MSWGENILNGGPQPAEQQLDFNSMGPLVGTQGAIGTGRSSDAHGESPGQADDMGRESIMSLLDYIGAGANDSESPSGPGAGGDQFGDISLSKLLSSVHELPSSPSLQTEPPFSSATAAEDAAETRAFLSTLHDESTGPWVQAAERRIY